MKLLPHLPLALLLASCGHHVTIEDPLVVEGTVTHEVVLSSELDEALSGTFSDLCAGHSQCVEEALANFYTRLSQRTPASEPSPEPTPSETPSVCPKHGKKCKPVRK